MLYIVQAVNVKTSKIGRKWLVRDAESMEKAEERIKELNEKETAEGEPLYDVRKEHLLVCPVEFEVNGVEEI